jgi:hypothetical protein
LLFLSSIDQSLNRVFEKFLVQDFMQNKTYIKDNFNPMTQALNLGKEVILQTHSFSWQNL